MRSIALVLALLPISAAAQVNVRWIATIDGGGAYSSESASALALTASGEVVVAGGRNTSSTTSTALDPFLARLSPSGAPLWSTTDPLAGVADGAQSVAIWDVDGSIHVLSSPGSFNQNGLRLAKFTGAGVPLWSRPYTAPAATTIAAGLALDASGNTTIAASIGATGAGQPVEVLDFLVESRDPAGGLRWSRLLDGGAGKGDTAKALAADSAGGLVVVGAWNQLQAGPCDAAIVRFDSAGNVLWSRTRNVVAGATHVFQDVAVDPAGNAYALGLVSNGPTILACELVAYDAAGNLVFATNLPAGAVGLDVEYGAGSVAVAGSQGASTFVARWSTNGSLAWTRTYTWAGAASTSGSRVRIDSAGDTTIAAYASTPWVQSVHTDLVVLRYAPDGVLRFNLGIAAPGSMSDMVGALAVDDTGAALVAGWRRDVVGAIYGPMDVLVVRVEPQSFALCLGDGTGAACPCGNASPASSQAGCVNSAGTGARMTDDGYARLGSDSLQLFIAGETATASTVVIQGSTSTAPTAFGDGLRCAGGTVRRLYTRTASNGIVNVPGFGGPPSVSARSAAMGDVLAPGMTRVYQAYYRDPNPTFCPTPAGNLWNMSSALLVRWSA
ncbi:MAG: hypothetical protein NTY35_04615 [Planctomycetota bacterium]|nr:hypothetical protein [Planctomycetota bacterium]